MKNPFLLFFLLFITVPVIEIYFLIQVGSVIGAFPTVGLIMLTALLGAGLIRVQGVRTIQRIQASLARGEIPAADIIEGGVLLLSGVFLLTPGFVTDAIGFVCLIPPLRRQFALMLIMSQFIQQKPSQTNDPYRQDFRGVNRDADIIEGEFKRERDSKDSHK